MVTYAELRDDPRQLLALTGLTAAEFDKLLRAFARCYGRRYPMHRTADGRPRKRYAGGGRKGVLHAPEQKLLFALAYLKAYPLQAVMAGLFGLSQPGVNYWLHRLLPLVRQALDELGVLPERHGDRVAGARPPASGAFIIDGTDRRRRRPKDPEKQAAHYTGKRKAHCDRNVVLLGSGDRRIAFLSRTYPAKVHDKRIADEAGIAYPPGAVLLGDTGFQGYEPAGVRTRRPKKKAARRHAHGRGEGAEPEVGAGAGPRGARAGGGEALPRRQGGPAEHQGRRLRHRYGSGLRLT